MAQEKSLLSIETAGAPEHVEIDGKLYALTDYDSFSITDAHRLQRSGVRMRELAALQEALTDAGAEEMESLADTIFDMIAGEIPDEVRAKLRFGARQRLVKHYFLAWGGLAVEQPEEPAPSENGPETTPLDSSDSMEETRQDG